ncbi:hypothetical protein SLE2022_327940 [Rubroshorea leprosula]
MDHRDLNSPKPQDLLGSTSSLSDCSGENAGFEKQLQDSKGCKVEKLPEMETKCLNYGNISTICTKQDANDMQKTSSLVTTSGDSILINESSSGGTLRVKSACNMPANEGNADGDVPSQAPEGLDLTQNISMRSDASSEIGEDLKKQNTELVNGTMNNSWLRNGKDRLKPIVQENCLSKQLKTESSSSNSTNVNFPASSNDSCQEITADTSSLKCHTTGADTSTGNKLRCSVEEAGERSSALGLATRISTGDVSDNVSLPPKEGNVENALEVVHNVGAKSCDSQLVVLAVADHKPVITEVDNTLKLNPPELEHAMPANHNRAESCSQLDDAHEVERRVTREVKQVIASGNSFVFGRSSETVNLNYADSAVPCNENCVAESRCITQLCTENDSRDNFCSSKEVVDQETPLGKKQLYIDIIKPPHDFEPKMTPEANHKQPSNISAKSEDPAVKGQTISTSDFDLNEDVSNEAECTEQLVKETVSYHVHGVFKPKPTMAQSGKIICLPVAQLELQDVGGWRGPAATSAFRLTSVFESFDNSKASSTTGNHINSKDSRVRGIDLNIAAVGVDSDMELLPEKCIPASSSFPLEESPLEVNSIQVERLNIDLNCANENEENFHQMFPPASSRRPPIRDFDLNDNPTSQDALPDAHEPGQGTLTLRNRALDNPAVSFLGKEKQQESNDFGLGYGEDQSPMQFFSHVHARPFLVAVPNILPNVEQMQRLEPVQAVYSSGVISYITDQNGPTIFPQVLGSSTQSAFSGTSQFTHIPGGAGPNGLAIIGPSFDPRSGVTLENGNRAENVGQRFIPVNNLMMEEQIRSLQPIALSGTAVKRREPEGGWDSHQHGYRQVTSWP